MLIELVFHTIFSAYYEAFKYRLTSYISCIRVEITNSFFPIRLVMNENVAFHAFHTCAKKWITTQSFRCNQTFYATAGQRMRDIVKKHAVATAPAFQIENVGFRRSWPFGQTDFILSKRNWGGEKGVWGKDALESFTLSLINIAYAQTF